MMHKGQGIPVASHRDNYFIRVVQSSDSLWKQKKGNCFLEETKKKATVSTSSCQGQKYQVVHRLMNMKTIRLKSLSFHLAVLNLTTW